MGKGEIWHPANQKPLNRSSPNLIHVITSSVPITKQNLDAIRPGVSSSHKRETYTPYVRMFTTLFCFHELIQSRGFRRLSVRLSVCKLFAEIASSRRHINYIFRDINSGLRPNFHRMVSRSACIQGVLKVKVKVKGHVIRALLFWHENRLFSQANGQIGTKLAHGVHS